MKQYIVDAFTDQVFAGNPAAICILNHWPSYELLQKITIENNLSETAFAVKTSDNYHLRWFTPGGEIDLCGHATLACAFVLLNFFEPDRSQVTFITKSGDLVVNKKNDLYEMNLPCYQLTHVEVTQVIIDVLGATPAEIYRGRDLVCVFNDEDTVRNLRPDLLKAKNLEGLLLHATAPGNEMDCVSRSFAPKCNVDEDPVCGSGHCHIVPIWRDKLGKDDIIAYQASSRGGTLYCRQIGDRILMSGKAVLFAISELFVS